MKRILLVSAGAGICLAGISLAPAAMAQTAVSFGTNWVAQGEHGGYYQAVEDGSYKECGLDVTIVPGGPQVNNRAMMLAGKVDFNMAGNLLSTFNAAAEGVPVVAIAAMFQKEPQVFLTHPGKGKTIDDLKKLKIYVSDEGFASYYLWLKSAYGFTDEQREVYTFNMAPFIADENTAIQGYVSSEPLMIQKEAGWTPDALLLADAGYATYSTLIETMADTVKNRPEVVQCFVDGSIKGWYNYLYGDASKADAKIKADNPELTDEALAFAREQMKAYGIVDSGVALEKGIGVMTKEHIDSFFADMAKAGAISPDLDYSAAYTLNFVGKGVGMELKK